ncbi:endonuclease/exonuclease/phosphatase family protein [Vibrio genomosp. F10]|uniref:endonuclease/exonuclease/phosphatase family protein n=1 Tax=Vibrio genomosp. F10 TaxID=723171 RepID=UPI000474FAE5|nr:hypothetical protein A1QI_13520 [Vibrio genomosp. F10 str. 9ZB36]
MEPNLKWIVWLLVVFPVFLLAAIWTSLIPIKMNWWLENLLAYPFLFLVYYLLLTVYAIVCRQKILVLVAIILCAGFYSLTPKHVNQGEVCRTDNPIELLQFNLYYSNPDVNAFMNYLIQHPADLVVLQEVSPEQGERFYTLDDIYPYRYGGQPAVGYPSSQLILSQHPLKAVTVFHTPDAQNIIHGEWQLTPTQSIQIVTAHPTSPRSKELWYRRNALIRTIETVVEQYPSPDTLVIGDFNLSSKAPLFNEILPGFTTLPVASWPNLMASWPNWTDSISANPWFSTPAFSMIAIDHTWLKSDQWALCSRQSIAEIKGSDHLPIRTKLGVKY